MDPVQEHENLMTAGPVSRALCGRRQEFLKNFIQGQGEDPDAARLSVFVYHKDCTERVAIIPEGADPADLYAPRIFSAFPSAIVPREFDSLSIVRAARDEGYSSPLLSQYEVAAVASGRSEAMLAIDVYYDPGCRSWFAGFSPAFPGQEGEAGATAEIALFRLLTSDRSPVRLKLLCKSPLSSDPSTERE